METIRELLKRKELTPAQRKRRRKLLIESGGGGGWVGVGGPPVIELSNDTVAEDATVGTLVGVASLSGSYTGTPSWVLAGADAAKYDIDANLGDVTVADTLADGTDDITIEVTGVTALPLDNPAAFVITVTVVETIATPTMTAVDAVTNDTTPDLNVNLPVDAEAGDTLLIQVSADGAGSWSTYVSHVLSAQDIIDDAITVPGAGALAAGAWDFRCRVERGAVVSDWSNTVDVTVDTTAPNVSSVVPNDNATGVAVGADIVITWNENVVEGTGTVTLKRTSDNVTIDSWSIPADEGVGAGQYEIAGGAVTFNASANRAGATEHYTIWDAGIFVDAAGNGVAAQASTTAFSFTTAASEEAETTALLARITGTAPDGARITAINNLIIALKAITFAKFVNFYDFTMSTETGTEADSFLNWIEDEHNLTEAGTITFDASGAIGTAGETLDPAFNPSTDVTEAFVLNSAHLGFYVETNAQSDSQIGGNSNARITPRTTGDLWSYRANDGTTKTGANVNSIGHWVWSRTASNVCPLYKDGTNINAGVTVSTAITNATLLAYNGGSGAQKVSFSHAGGALTAGEVSDLFNAIAAYRTAIGL